MEGGMRGQLEERESKIMSPNRSAAEVSHLAVDIGGSLIKVVYSSSNNNNEADDKGKKSSNDCVGIPNGSSDYPVLCGRLHFAKFETSKINDCLEFISSKQLHQCADWHHEASSHDKNIIKATGGGAYKFADLFKEKLGVSLDKVDEMDCLVAGSNFLLKTVHPEAFTYIDGREEYVQIDHNDLYPYLLVNIGSGVSMIKVDGDGKFERVSGTSVGGGTFWGLGKLLTKCKSFDELLELSQKGNNRVIDMLVGDIYGGVDCPKISYLNALRFGLNRIFFGGFFIRGHAYTMDTISVAVHFWSKGEAKAMFLRHEGFLGALGAFTSYESHGLNDITTH
ncbi:pantothenate kinase 2-like isoform X3 [Actinidia eriantha]|uniref:pantothenate kinase 2-like isoform X3 n=1 Tax=Actinidia eriantha TaxID=165200 RepID=UPI002589DCC9|nr:pantothenate kinase 2-like isoform X3 [Actinidia eriantha]